MARQFLFDAWHQLSLAALARSRDARIAEIAAKSAKEVAYHVERSADWVIRLGDGTGESHAKMQAAIDELWTYTGEMFAADPAELALAEAGIVADVRALAAPWRQRVGAVLEEATLALPADAHMQKGGKQGVHTEHLGYLLAEMQFLQRAYPGRDVVNRPRDDDSRAAGDRRRRRRPRPPTVRRRRRSTPSGARSTRCPIPRSRSCRSSSSASCAASSGTTAIPRRWSCA